MLYLYNYQYNHMSNFEALPRDVRDKIFSFLRTPLRFPRHVAPIRDIICGIKGNIKSDNDDTIAKIENVIVDMILNPFNHHSFMIRHVHPKTLYNKNMPVLAIFIDNIFRRIIPIQEHMALLKYLVSQPNIQWNEYDALISIIRVNYD